MKISKAVLFIILLGLAVGFIVLCTLEERMTKLESRIADYETSQQKR